MHAVWERVVQTVARRRAPERQAVPPEAAEAREDLELVRQAHQEWLAAKAYFESVSDPELVDHAIALLTAAEQRYAYLLRRARRSGLVDDELERLLGAGGGPGDAGAPAGEPLPG